jgi:membrane protease YdiL (CAAX protease family)
MAEPDRSDIGPLPEFPPADPLGSLIPTPPAVDPEYQAGQVLPSYALLTPQPFPAWTGLDVLTVMGATVFTIFACSAVALWVGHSLLHHVSLSALAQNPFIVIGSQIASYPIVIAFMAKVVRDRSDAGFLEAIRWRWPGTTGSWFGLLGFVLAFSIEALSHFLPIPKSLPMDRFFTSPGSAYLMAFFGILIAPLLEELFFRGMLYPVLRRRWGISVAVVLTAAAFAAIHSAQLGYAWAPILSIFFVGVALTLVRQITDSVAASVLTHAGYNFTLFALLWLASNHFHNLDKLNS